MTPEHRLGEAEREIAAIKQRAVIRDDSFFTQKQRLDVTDQIDALSRRIFWAGTPRELVEDLTKLKELAQRWLQHAERAALPARRRRSSKT